MKNSFSEGEVHVTRKINVNHNTSGKPSANAIISIRIREGHTSRSYKSEVTIELSSRDGLTQAEEIRIKAELLDVAEEMARRHIGSMEKNSLKAVVKCLSAAQEVGR